MKYLVILIAIFLIACQTETKRAEYLWEEEKAIDVFTDIQLAEGVIRVSSGNFSDTLIHRDSIYASLFRKHNIQKWELDSNFNFLLKQPEKLDKIYEKVIERLSEQSARVKLEQPEDLPENINLD